MNKALKTKMEKGVSAVLSVLVVLMLLAVGYLTYCNMTGRVAYIGKYAVVRILTSSMEPTIPTGGYILVEKITADQVRVGDVIVFYSRDPAIYGKLNTHRVMEILTGDHGAQFVTRGDHNDANDALTTASGDVVGRYQKNLPGVTRFAQFFVQKWVFFFLILVPSFLLIVLCIWDVVRKSKEIKMDLLVAQEVQRLKEQQDAKADPQEQKQKKASEEAENLPEKQTERGEHRDV